MNDYSIDEREKVLKGLGASKSSIEELLNYNTNVFQFEINNLPTSLPLEDEPFIDKWNEYAEDAKILGVFNSLQKRLVQLCFPIREGISELDSYKGVTRRGELPEVTGDATGLLLNKPENIKLQIYQSTAGKIPILISSERDDFKSLVRAFLYRNEPETIPDSMGAVMVSGFNNWDRIRDYRKKWVTLNPNENSDEDWSIEFKKLIPQKSLYQDRFIILSDGPYSGVSNTVFGLSAEEWGKASLIIRREHECAHYFTRRVFNSMRNNLMDELIADYMGIVAVLKKFNADWFLNFVGLENLPKYREGARLENYRGEPVLSDAAFVILKKLIVKAATNLERFDQNLITTDRTSILLTLTSMTLEELADDNGVSNLKQQFTLTGNQIIK